MCRMPWYEYICALSFKRVASQSVVLRAHECNSRPESMASRGNPHAPRVLGHCRPHACACPKRTSLPA